MINDNGFFEFSFERFSELRLQRSPIFFLGNFQCQLELRHESCPVYHNIYLIYDDTTEVLKSETVILACLIDINGEEVVITKRKGMISPLSCLLSVNHEEIEGFRSQVLPNDTLKIRISWYEALYGAVKHSEKEAIKCVETLSSDFSRYFESKADTDCVLNVRESQFLAHRQFLAARSEVFAAMFKHDMAENRIVVVNIPDVDATVMTDVLHYVYSGRIRGVTSDTAVPMYVVADKYSLDELKDICFEVLKCGLKVENVCEAAMLAYNYDRVELENEVVQFIQMNFEKLENTSEWQNFSDAQPKLAIQLLGCALLASKEKVKTLSAK